jgi:hypothetical protein
MTLKECLAALRAEKLVALSEPAAVDSEAGAGGEEQNRPVTTAVRSEPTNIYPGNTGNAASGSCNYPRKPDDSDGQSEIYPRSTCISPSTAVKLVQGDIVFGNAQGHLKKTESDTGKVEPLGEIRVDRGVSRVDQAEGVGEVGEKVPEMAATAAQPERPKKPHFTPGGTLVIPFDSDPKYHWWKGGQSVKKTIAELRGETVEEAPAEGVPEDRITEQG